jgi:hypothetical protein
MGRSNPHSFPHDHLSSHSSGEISPAFSRRVESLPPEAYAPLADALADNPSYGWEAAWIDLGGEG